MRKSLSKITPMSNLIIRTLIAFSFMNFALSQESERNKEFTKVGDGHDTEMLFSEARILNEKLGSLKVEDLIYVSNRMYDGIKDKVSVPNASEFVLYSTPQMIYLKHLNSEGNSTGGFLVCSIYPYKDLVGGGVGETTEPRWVQGKKRFDVWSNQAEIWKVVLDVDINNLKDVFKNPNHSVALCDTPDEAIKEATRIIKRARETDDALEQAIQEKMGK
jgi:hypothetical protein